MFDPRVIFRPKSSIFSTISYAAVIYLIIISAHSLIYNFSLQSIIQVYIVDDHTNLIPPVNVSKKERIYWFKKNLHKFDILKPTSLSTQFDGRATEFFNGGLCKVKFFMTWISPVNTFGEREFISIESLFKSNPHGCLMILSKTLDSSNGFQILKPLTDQGFRILAATPDLTYLLNNTPAESWFSKMRSGNRDPGEIPLGQNLSNLIRLATLYKYGGVYLDTDFIVLKDFSALRNSIGAQSMDGFGNWTRLNNAVLVFDNNHPLLYKFLQEFALTFDGNKWGHNGPYLVSRVVDRVKKRTGYNFTVMPPMAFYPVDWTRVRTFFAKPRDRVISKWVEDKVIQLREETYGVHLWNRESSKFSIEQGSIIDRLVSNSCAIYKHLYS